MKLSIATNWEKDLIEELSPFPISELFGALASTPVGGGRPSFLLASTTRQDAAEYVNAAHDKGWSFDYLLNAPCMGNMEYDKETHRSLIQHLEWLCDIGVDTVTVSIPYLLEIIKRQFPELKVKVSVIAHVNSIPRACFYESLGADEITIDYMSNRDFEFLRGVREAVSCDLTLLLNDMCLYQCPYRTYHFNICGHASQEWHPMGGFYVDYCMVSCTIQKLSDPAQLIRSRWIRPEDLSRYEALGYQKFKISGRRMSTAWLTRATAAYAQRRFDGNLMDILNGVTVGADPDSISPQFKTLLSDARFLQAERIVLALGQISPVKPFVDNGALDGFLDYFETQDCANRCASCAYCEAIAERAVRSDEKEIQRYIAALRDLQDDLISSRVFPEGHEPSTSQEEKRIMEWESQTKKDFDKLISFVPESQRSMARQVVATVSEDMAQERAASAVQREDMVRAFLQCTPDASQANMLHGLRALGIDPDEFRCYSSRTNPMKITLILAAADHDPLRKNKPHMPLSLPLLAASAPGHEYTLVDMLAGEQIDYSAPVDLVGISARFTAQRTAFELADEYRRRGVPVVLGGPQMSAVPFLALEHADAVVIGEGESLWPVVVDDAWRGQLRKLYIASPKPFDARGHTLYQQDSFLDLDTVPRARRELFSKRYVFDTVFAARGCPMRCDFCSVPQLFGSRTRLRPVAKVVEEIKGFKGFYYLLDDTVFGRPATYDYYLELYDAIAALPKLRLWIGQANLDAAANPKGREVIRRAARAGLTYAAIGMESLNPAVLKKAGTLHKLGASSADDVIAKMKEHISFIQEAGIAISGWFTIGYEEDTIDTFFETLEFCQECNIIPITNPLGALPGTPLYERMVAEGRLDNEGLINIAHPTMSGEQRVEAMGQVIAEGFSVGQILKRTAFYAQRFDRSTPHLGRRLRNAMQKTIFTLVLQFKLKQGIGMWALPTAVGDDLRTPT